MIASKEEVINELNKFISETKEFKAFVANINIFRFKWFKTEKLRNILIEQIISISVEKMIKKVRKWNKTKYPNFEDFFRMSCISEIKNIWTANKNKKDKSSNTKESKKIDISNEYDVYQGNKELFNVDFIQMLENEFPEYEELDLINYCYNQLKRDFDKIVYLYLNEGKKENEIAKEMGVDIIEIYNSNKRIKRIVRPILEEKLDIKKTKNNNIVFSL